MDPSRLAPHRQPLTPLAPEHPYDPEPGAHRPLSDIREITEPSLIDSAHRRPYRGGEHAGGRPTRASSTKRRAPEPLQAQTNSRRGGGPAGYMGLESGNVRAGPSPNSRPRSRQSQKSPRKSADSHRSGRYAIPVENIPPRSSSRQQHRPSNSLSREPAVHVQSQIHRNHSVTNRGHSRSPIKEAISRLVPENKVHRAPSMTLIRAKGSGHNDTLDHPSHHHPRLKVELQVAAPLFVGGSSAEGVIRIVVDAAERVRHRKMLILERISVDLIGIEEVSGPRRHIFLALGNELIDASHPPPIDMVQSILPQNPYEPGWILVPSVSVLPFLITLPLEVGPPPFQSKHARIRYVLSVTLFIKDAGRQLVVRCTQDTSVLSVYDPEKALVSLPSPLTASDEFNAHHGADHVIATAGLHRQVWVSGTSIFADVHIVNDSRKKIKKLELQLERIIFCYRHAAAATMEMSASQARLFDSSERTVICKSTIKHGTQGWNGVLPHTHDLRTCHLEVPRGHATIKCYKYFEVRYYLNVVVGTSHTKLAMVQLPIILIHMNSLDVPTNSVAQVAAAIEEKQKHANASSNAHTGNHNRIHRRATSRQHNDSIPAAGTTAQGSPRLSRNPSRLQGRAFAAPRMASLERQRAHAEDLSHLRHAVDTSPRKRMARVTREDSVRAPKARTEALLPPLPLPPRFRDDPRYEPPLGLRYDGTASSGEHSHGSGSGSGRGPSFGFKTPPSRRKGRLLNEDEKGGLRERLGEHPAMPEKSKGKERWRPKGHARSIGGSNTSVTNNITKTSPRDVEVSGAIPPFVEEPPKRAASAMDSYSRPSHEILGMQVDEATQARLDASFTKKLTSQRSFGQFGLGRGGKAWGKPRWL